MNPAEPVLSNIEDEWERVKPPLDALFAECPSFDSKAEYVYEACLKEEADLWMTPEGFLVTRFLKDEDTGIRTLFLWVCCSFGGKLGGVGQYFPFLEVVAKHTDCKYIETWSQRAGMERYLAKQGYDLYYRAYRKEVV
jgi:hypothetical protein